MIVESEFLFDAGREAVYEALQDPEILAGALPGTERLELVGEHRYEGMMVISVGPVTAARFEIGVRLSDLVRPERFTMEVEGRGKAGFVTGVAEVELEERGEACLMRYRAELGIGGRVASVGQRLLDTVARAMTRRGLKTVNGMIT